MQGVCNGYRSWTRGRTRIFLAWIFVLIIGFFSKKYPTFPGVLICFLGATLRFLASGYLKKDAQPAVGGPYRFVRNPLYLGTYFMALGMILVTQSWVLFVLFHLVFYCVYYQVIVGEEEKLKLIFKENYFIYCQLVPRFFPKCIPASPRELMQVNSEMNQDRFSFQLAIANKAYEAYISWLGWVAFVSLMAYFWQRVGRF